MNWIDAGQGFLRKNFHSDAYEYESFVPARLDQVVPIDLPEETVVLLASCSRRVGELKGMLRFVPNAQMYLAMYVRKEALLSAQIEGTQCTLDDILSPSDDKAIERDVADVINYVRAAEYAAERMRELPLCMRLLREVHGILLSGARGYERNPGEVRTSQNWIGPQGCTIRTAAYVPPNVEDMERALSDLECFVNDERGIDPIVKAALVHYQFETVHPFLDGNGRLGRLLITLSLVNDGELDGLAFYPSFQLKRRRAEYYDSLMRVRERGDYASWVGFFCECLLDSAEDAIGSLDRLVRLHNDNVTRIDESMGRSAGNGRRLLELLEGHPYTTAKFVAEGLDVSEPTARTLLSKLQEMGMVALTDSSAKRYRTYAYEDYLAILREGSDPL